MPTDFEVRAAEALARARPADERAAARARLDALPDARRDRGPDAPTSTCPACQQPLARPLDLAAALERIAVALRDARFRRRG